ncbi:MULTISPECIES: methyl-accepting chemotaxis protein [Vibrio]|uniref:Methyl-accepting chemotaxis protein n=1 Tax=Vibrio coralliilyticus TaxID=190893 RepID=A0AAP6ZSB3_9VIBR|nr:MULTISPECIES: methyl-accepting chemotaxis protein [Vibrio]ANW25863.1 chemotaxis protein [Vibrio coralliilyticus]ARC94747.1 methyl-accepting chemotaxis protein [Vibrio coralliilyticus]MCM5509128.1 methyl-accepting chemotaxis protein [Vibrio sp. SCSIO 43169]MDE3896943.1 methyl-accepting chemotaxis protein [Vibrio sp. CC007]NOI60605.1 methyl-accepting chemotaxis protein [Vibrio coralliilyticus]
MNIKNKLYSLGAVAILGVVSLLLTTSHFAQTTNQLNNANLLVAKLEIRLLNLRRNEKDFLLRKDMKYLDKFNKNMDIFLDLESELAPVLDDNDLPSSSQVRQDILKYQSGFTNLVNAFDALGLKPEEKLLGKYNTELKELKPSLSSEQLVNLFEFDKNVAKGEVQAQLLPGNASQLIAAANQVVAQKKTIGLKYNEGLLGDARGLSHAVETQFKTFAAALDEQSEITRKELTLIKQGVSIAVVVFILGFIFQISRSINLQVAALLSIIQEIARSNNVALRSQLSGKNELVSIGNYFNRLLDKLEALISGTQSKSSELSQSTQSMHNELQSVIEQFHVQADHTSTMATSVQEMVSTINEISESTAVAVEGVQQASVNAQHGREVVEETVKNIGQLSSILSDSQGSISSLNDHVDKIGDAVNIIQGIAEQTNLLALNAAIEAARAGEQGRGFAVVADEVRALASRTHQSTEEITKVVTAIQTQMATVVTNIDQCNEQGQQTLGASETLDESLGQIITDMTNIQANSERIASAIEEQGIVMNQVSESITELNSISEGNMHSAQNCLNEVDKVSLQASEMDQAVAEFQTSK